MSLSLDKTIQRLQSYSNSTFPILSVYLKVPTKQEVSKLTFLNQFQTLIKTNLTSADQSLLENDIQEMEGFLSNIEDHPSFNGLILFSGGNQLWEEIKTDLTFEPLCQINHSPYLDPLYKALNDFRRYLVILADRERGRYFTIFLNHFEDPGEMIKDKGEVPQKIKPEGRRQNKVDRHIQEHLDNHIEHVCSSALNYAKLKNIDGVIVGGHKELVHKIEDFLPSQLKHKIIGEFVSNVDAPLGDLTEKSKQVIAHHTS